MPQGAEQIKIRQENVAWCRTASNTTEQNNKAQSKSRKVKTIEIGTGKITMTQNNVRIQRKIENDPG